MVFSTALTVFNSIMNSYFVNTLEGQLLCLIGSNYIDIPYIKTYTYQLNNGEIPFPPEVFLILRSEASNSIVCVHDNMDE